MLEGYDGKRVDILELILVWNLEKNWAFEGEKCLENSTLLESVRARVFFTEYAALNALFIQFHWLLSEQNFGVKNFVNCGCLEYAVDIKSSEGVSYEIWKLYTKFRCFRLWVERIVRSWSEIHLETKTTKRTKLENMNVI